MLKATSSIVQFFKKNSPAPFPGYLLLCNSRISSIMGTLKINYSKYYTILMSLNGQGKILLYEVQ